MALVVFTAPWSARCRGLAPHWERLALAFDGMPVLVANVPSEYACGATRGATQCSNSELLDRFAIEGFPEILWRSSWARSRWTKRRLARRARGSAWARSAPAKARKRQRRALGPEPSFAEQMCPPPSAARGNVVDTSAAPRRSERARRCASSRADVALRRHGALLIALCSAWFLPLLPSFLLLSRALRTSFGTFDSQV